MLIPPAYISFRRINKFQQYFKLKKKHVDEPIFENSISSGEENDDSDSEPEHDGEGLSLIDVNKVVNQAVDVVKHPSKLINQAVEVMEYPANKLVNQVEHVIRHPEDILHRLVPVKGAGLANEEDQMSDNDANSNDAAIDVGEIEDRWMEPDAKVRKLEECEHFGDFQRADKHIPCRIPETTKKYPQRECVSCRRRGIRHDTRYYCNDCSDNPALCKDCFTNFNHM